MKLTICDACGKRAPDRCLRDAYGTRLDLDYCDECFEAMEDFVGVRL